jgi:hypothetical protein
MKCKERNLNPYPGNRRNHDSYNPGIIYRNVRFGCGILKSTPAIPIPVFFSREMV